MSIGGKLPYCYTLILYIFKNIYTTVQEFLQTLDVSVCRDALKKTFNNNGGVELLKAIIQGDGAEPDNPQPPASNLPWCKCGRCRPMLQDIENICCRKRFCVTLEEFFESAILDLNVLSIAIVNRSEVRICR